MMGWCWVLGAGGRQQQQQRMPVGVEKWCRGEKIKIRMVQFERREREKKRERERERESKQTNKDREKRMEETERRPPTVYADVSVPFCSFVTPSFIHQFILKRYQHK